MTAEIISNANIAGKIYEMIFSCPEIADIAKPGQFVYIQCKDSLVLRRPISIFNAENGRITICYEIRGEGTQWMAELKSGSIIDVMGPIGHGYTFHEGKRALLCGGGIGIYPLYMIGKLYGKNAAAAFGFRNKEAINSIEHYENAEIDVKIATDDGSHGHSGFATDIVKAELEGGGYDIIYACGPKPMMKIAAELAEKYGIACEVSMEERMGCGIGACEACVCKIKTKDGDDYKRVCVDGPVFDAKEIVW